MALALAVAPIAARADASQAEADDALFRAGKFADAQAQYATIAASTPRDYHATLQLGRIALLGNRFTEAEAWLMKAHALQPGETDAQVTLAEVYYREDAFDKAAAALKGIDVGKNQLIQSQYGTLNVAKLQSFAGQTPYQVQGDGSATTVKLLQTEPLPLVIVRVNGGKEVTFFIDTGGSEIALDTEFARELGVPNYGGVEGTFSGGQQATVSHTRIDSFGIGGWTIRNIPAVMLPLRQLSELAGGRTIDGLIGTTLFSHFLTTLDYPRGELVLRKKEAPFAPSGVRVPFWMAGDHFMVGWGQVDTQPPSLMFVDTGLIGAGVKLGETMLKAARIKLETDKAQTGAGAGGTLRTVPYTVRSVSFGAVRETEVPGLYDGPFPWEHLFGFYLAGMLGHDFYRPYAVTFDFDRMEIDLARGGGAP
ncbi:MAG: hypothetical protein BGO51_26820 [Rhodospirillales bacterium 69-11]|nr:MAG: hypothetical protein BGO51_26820 [Rhodospirillales bacterium 69-11]